MAIDRIVAFGDFRIDPQKRQLTARGVPVDLKPRVFEALLLFVESDGRLLTKEELIASLWPDVIVEENNLTQCISALRKALGDGRDGQRFIVTESRRGYRCVAETRFVEAPEPTPIGQGGLASHDSPDLRSGLWTGRLAIGAALFIVVGGLVVVTIRPSSEPPSPVSGAITSLAVLPFKQVDSDAQPVAVAGASADLGLRLADAVIARLTPLRVVTVRPTDAVRHFAETDPDVVRAGYDLDVDAVVEGVFRHRKGVLRVSLRLVVRRTGDQVWFQSFEMPWNSVFEETLAEQATGEMVRALKSTRKQTSAPLTAPHAAGLGIPSAIPFAILVADAQAFDGGGGVILIDPVTGSQTALASGGVFVNPTGLAVGPGGDLFVADTDAIYGMGAVIRLRFDAHMKNWTRTVVSKGGTFRDPVSLAIDRDGALLVVDFDGPWTDGGRVVKVDVGTGAQTVVSEGQHFHLPMGIAIDRDGRYIVADSFPMLGGASQVIRIDPRQPGDANQMVISSAHQMEDPIGVAFDAVGRLFVADANTVRLPSSPGHIFQIDVATGAQRRITSGGLLQQPRDLRFGPTGDLFVVDDVTAAIVRVDPVTGAQTAVSAGGMLVSPQSMAILVDGAGKPR